jgi:hypothetical protein
MQRMTLFGNERTSYRQNFLSSLLAQPNLEDEIPFKGGRLCRGIVAGGGLDEDPTEECRLETGAEEGQRDEGLVWRRIGAVEVLAWPRAGMEAHAEQGPCSGGSSVDEGWHGGGPA